jgi:hypothetical protein
MATMLGFVSKTYIVCLELQNMWLHFH